MLWGLFTLQRGSVFLSVLSVNTSCFFFASFFNSLPTTSPTLPLHKLCSSPPSLPVWLSSGGFCVLPGWSPTHLNHHRVPIQTLSLAASLPLVSHSADTCVSPAESDVFRCILLCFAAMTSSLLLYALNPSLWLNLLADNKVMLTESLLALVTLKIKLIILVKYHLRVLRLSSKKVDVWWESFLCGVNETCQRAL